MDKKCPPIIGHDELGPIIAHDEYGKVYAEFKDGKYVGLWYELREGQSHGWMLAFRKMQGWHDDLSSVDDDALISALEEERKKFTQQNKSLMKLMIDELIARQVYPSETLPGNRNSVTTMVECWGADWHVWKSPFNCPHCNADLRDQKVGPPFKREIGVYDVAKDRTTHYQCPDCKKDIPR